MLVLLALCGISSSQQLSMWHKGEDGLCGLSKETLCWHSGESMQGWEGRRVCVSKCVRGGPVDSKCTCCLHSWGQGTSSELTGRSEKGSGEHCAGLFMSESGIQTSSTAMQWSSCRVKHNRTKGCLQGKGSTVQAPQWSPRFVLREGRWFIKETQQDWQTGCVLLN